MRTILGKPQDDAKRLFETFYRDIKEDDEMFSRREKRLAVECAVNCARELKTLSSLIKEKNIGGFYWKDWYDEVVNELYKIKL